MRPCVKCGHAIHNNVEICPDCGEQQDPPRHVPEAPGVDSKRTADGFRGDPFALLQSLSLCALICLGALIGLLQNGGQ